jgi:spore maturation protein CgeB
VRFLVFRPGPGFSVQDVAAGWGEALRAAGQHVVEYNTDDRLLFFSHALMPTEEAGQFRRALRSMDEIVEQTVDGIYGCVMKTRPHVLIVVSGFFTPPQMLEVIRAAGVKVVIVHTEAPYEDERQLAIAAHADFNIINDPTNLERFQDVAPTEYFPHAYRPTVHHPGDPLPELACDLAFVGTGFPSRVEFLERMDLAGLDVILAGNWALFGDPDRYPNGHPLAQHVIHAGLEDCLDNDKTADLYRAARVGLNLYRREAKENDTADGWAMGPREVEMAACGLPFVRDPRPESDELFGGILPSFSCPEEAAEQIRWLLAHQGIREVAAEKARAAIAERTFDNHAARLLRLLEKE